MTDDAFADELRRLAREIDTFLKRGTKRTLSISRRQAKYLDLALGRALHEPALRESLERFRSIHWDALRQLQAHPPPRRYKKAVEALGLQDTPALTDKLPPLAKFPDDTMGRAFDALTDPAVERQVWIALEPADRLGAEEATVLVTDPPTALPMNEWSAISWIRQEFKQQSDLALVKRLRRRRSAIRKLHSFHKPNHPGLRHLPTLDRLPGNIPPKKKS